MFGGHKEEFVRQTGESVPQVLSQQVPSEQPYDKNDKAKTKNSFSSYPIEKVTARIENTTVQEFT